MTRPKIIIASAHRYLSPTRLGTSYLAESLCIRGWDVLFLEQPTSPVHLLHPRSRKVAGKKFASALNFRRRSPEQPEEGGAGAIDILNVVTAWPHMNAPFLRSHWTLENWWRLTLPPLQGSIRRRGFENASAFLFDSPYFYPLARALGIKSVYRLADRLQHFPEVTPAMLALQEEVIARSDLVVYTARVLANDLAARSGPALYLPNGVDLRAYARRHPKPPELSSIPTPRVIYSGTVGPWFDAEIVSKAARDCPDIQFIILGKVIVKHPRLESLPNVHFIGEVPFQRVPEFLEHCQASIIPFDVMRMPDLVGGINPLKLYEYCAAGLPVVSYVSEEIDAMAAPIRGYRTHDEFVAGIRAALQDNGEDARQQRLAWAQTASWEVRAAALAGAISSL